MICVLYFLKIICNSETAKVIGTLNGMAALRSNFKDKVHVRNREPAELVQNFIST